MLYEQTQSKNRLVDHIVLLYYYLQQVASFTGEKLAIAKYDEFLVDAYKSGVQEGTATGLTAGFTWLIVFCTYALATWFGGKMILEKGYTGGEVLNVIVAILTGSMLVTSSPGKH